MSQLILVTEYRLKGIEVYRYIGI